MTRKNATLQTLFTSVMSLLLCVSMLVGTTFAWFTDSVVSGTNTIAAGNLDVELEYYKDGNWATVNAVTDLFSKELWEPGHTEVVYLRLSNLGTLALKYQLGINIVSETEGTNVAGETFKLSDHIYMGVVENAQPAYTSREAAIAAAKDGANGIIGDGYVKNGTMLAGQNALNLAVVVYMPESVGNEANYKTGTTAPVINLGINLFATQKMSEDDSFGDDYDANANILSWDTSADTSWYDAAQNEFVLYTAEELAGLAVLVNEATDGFAGKTVKLGADIDLGGKKWIPIGDVDADDFVGFKGTFDGQGNTIKNLYINTNSWGQGLFGYMDKSTNATIQNVNVNNAYVKATDNCGVIVGYATNGTFSNIHVTGDVTITGTAADGYVGGIAGCGYNATFANCSVEGATITSKGSFAGGIVGYQCNNSKQITGCSLKNSSVTGYGAVGGISGIIQTGSTAVSGCSVENVVLTKTRVDGNPSIGALVGCYSNTEATVLGNNTVNGVTLNGSHVAYGAYNDLYGSEYGGATSPNFDISTTTVTGITNYLVEIAAISDAASLKAAFENGGNNYVLTKDVTVANNETITLANGVSLVIDLNGHKISSTADKSGNQELFLVKGNLTVKNGSMEYTASNNQGWNAMITIFDVTAGGVLNMEKVTAKVGGSDMNFIVHLNNWGEVTLNVNDCDFTASYVAIRAFNSGYDMNNVTVKNTAFHNGRVFWVHNYTKEGAGDSTLNVEIYGNGNTTDNAKPVRYGFSDPKYYTIEGNAIVSDAASLSAELAKGGTVVLGADIKATDVVTLAEISNVVATLDLNGHNITAELNGSAGWSQIFRVSKGATFTVVGEGKVHATAYPTQTYGSVIFNNVGGDLIIKGGTYTMEYGTYAEGYLLPAIVDTNSNTMKATTTIEGGEFYHNRNMFRNFAQPNRGANNATLIINGGTFVGEADDYATIWNQKTSASGVEGDGVVIINGGNFQYMDVCNDFDTGVTIADGLNIAVQS